MTTRQLISQTGTSELLHTKLAPPQLRPPLVPRTKLLDKLDRGLERKLTVLSAPAGYGKTTLVSQWIAARSAELRVLSSELPSSKVTQNSKLLTHNSHVAWVALDTGDNDAVRFWRYVFAACQALGPAIGSAARNLLRASARPDYEATLTALINDLAGLPYKGLLILEDYHLITTPEIHDQLGFVLDHLPTTLHVVLLTRSDPPLPLARLRVQHQLNELRADDLRFSPAETQMFLQQALPYALPGHAITSVDARTEGWVAGLRLIALALERRSHPDEVARVLDTVSGGHRHVMTYLVTEVLHAQPESIQTFLLRTSGLGRLTGPLCDAVTGRTGSAAVLEQLQRANLFVVPLDEDGQWYRYHALFAEAMQHEALRHLGQDALDACAVSASAWYEQQGMFTEAVEAALDARGFDRAAALLEHSIRPQHYQELIEYHTLRRWLSSLPEAILARFPTLCLRLAMVVLFSTDGRSLVAQEQMERALTLAEQFWRAQNNRSGMGIVRAARALIAGELGDLTLAARLAGAALPDLPEQEHNWRGACLRLLGAENLADGAVREASQRLVAARAQFDAAGNSHGARATLLKLGDAYAMQGALHQAAEVYRAVNTLSSMDLHDRGNALLSLAGLSYEWNALDVAEQEARTAYELGERIADEPLQVRAGLALARIQHACGDTSQAQQLLFALLTYARQPLLVRAVEAAQARLALAIGDLTHVQRWYAAFLQQREHIPHAQYERAALVGARLLIAQGEALAALQLLDEWRAEAHAAGRIRRVLEMHVITALAHTARADFHSAQQTLEAALESAQPEGYVRLFLDEGPMLLDGLRTLVSAADTAPLSGYARSLLHADLNGRAELRSALVASPAHAPLSPQEQRVLQLLAAGHSNPEMAQALVVSINTVKTHIKSIYRKLNVTNRIEAYTAARRQQLI